MGFQAPIPHISSGQEAAGPSGPLPSIYPFTMHLPPSTHSSTIHLSIYFHPPILPSIIHHPSMYLFTICLSSMQVSIHTSPYPSLSPHPFTIHPSIHPSIHLSIYLHPPILPSIHQPSIYPPTICPSSMPPGVFLPHIHPSPMPHPCTHPLVCLQPIHSHSTLSAMCCAGCGNHKSRGGCPHHLLTPTQAGGRPSSWV